MATNQNPRPLLSAGFTAWVADLPTTPTPGPVTHPVGTNIRDIPHFDRGIKVVFACREHPQYEYMSKEPHVSQWFPANKATQGLQWGEVDECPHKYPSDDVWLTTRPYSPEAGA